MAIFWQISASILEYLFHAISVQYICECVTHYLCLAFKSAEFLLFSVDNLIESLFLVIFCYV